MTVLLTLAGTAGATSYTWSGPAWGNWTNANNWSPSGFSNRVVDVCIVNSGGQLQINNTNGTTVSFAPQLTLNAGAILVTVTNGLVGNGTIAFTNLHLNGGLLWLFGNSNLTVKGAIAVDAQSYVTAEYGAMTNSAVFSGSGNLVITNTLPSGKNVTFSGASTNYSGTWILVGNGLGGGFLFDNNTSLGSGSLCVTNCPVASYIVTNSIPMVLDMRGYSFDMGYTSGPYSYTNTISLQSDGFFRTRASGGPINLNGNIDSTGAKLTLGVFNASSSTMIVLNHTNNTYTGGTIITNSFYTTSPNTAYAQAAAPGCLGAGDLWVTPGAALLITNTTDNVMNPAASLYLDSNGTYIGRLALAVSTTTTVAKAFVSGTGGSSGSGYATLYPGTYTSNNLPGYITGGGTLLVVAPLTQPLIQNYAVSNVTATSATMTGLLVTNGGSPATVSLYWGTTNSVINANNWANTNTFTAGQWNSGDSPTTNITTLIQNRNYYATFGVTNGNGAWVYSPALKFITGAITLNATASLFGYNGSNGAAATVTIGVSCPATCTNEATTVYYTTSGTATNGVDYIASPASGALVIAPGQTNAILTLTPIYPPLNYGTAKSIVLTVITPPPPSTASYVTNASSTANCTLLNRQSVTYTWIGTNNAIWTTAANWDPPGFANGTADVCYVNSGGRLQIDNANTMTRTFYAHLNLPAGATISTVTSGTQLGYGNITFTDLQFNGGTLQLCGNVNLTLNGAITVASNSTIVAVNANQDSAQTFNAVFSGSGNLLITNGLSIGSKGSAAITVNASSPAYSGTWIVVGTGLGGQFYPNNNAGLGSGSLCVTNCPVQSWIINNFMPMVLDMSGYAFDIGYAQGPYYYNGPISLQSDGFIRTRASAGGTIYIKGNIDGTGAKLTLGVVAASTSAKIVLNHTNNTYTGGTIITNGYFASAPNTSYAQANAPGCLGTGNLWVTPGATLSITTTNVMNRAANLYLDNNGTYTGRLDLATSTTTTVTKAYIGGTGGWLAPVGYTTLAPGPYTTNNLAMRNYLTSSGTLVVLPSMGAVIIFR
jgi:hypothetical protein